jgi:hypothetical protein
MSYDEVEQRVRERAYKIWIDEGKPEGQADAHWEKARLIVSVEDSMPTMLKPITEPQAEPVEAYQNQGEFPTLTDQGEQNNPAWPGIEK